MSPVHLSKEQVQQIGALLKSSREAQGENLAEVAFRIALSPSQLRAIESGDLRPFYSPGYFLQAAERYANFLNVVLPQRAAETSAAETPAAVPVREESTDETAATTARETSKPIKIAQPEVVETATQSSTLTQSVEPNLPAARSRAWGWLAFGAAVLIALGIIKISFDKPIPTDVATNSATTAPTNSQLSTTTGATTATAPAPATPAVTPAPTAPPATASTAPTAPTSPPTTTPTATPAPVAAKAAAPTTPITPTAAPQDRLTTPSKTVGALTSAPKDSQLESQASTWVQLVKSNGEKINLKIEPGQKIEFAANTTAAVVFGQPDKAVLKIRDRTINLKPFVAPDNPSRALVILNQIRD